MVHQIPSIQQLPKTSEIRHEGVTGANQSQGKKNIKLPKKIVLWNYITLQASTLPFPFMQVSEDHRHKSLNFTSDKCTPPLLCGEGRERRVLEQAFQQSVLGDSTLQASTLPFPFMQVSEDHRHKSLNFTSDKCTQTLQTTSPNTQCFLYFNHIAAISRHSKEYLHHPNSKTLPAPGGK